MFPTYLRISRGELINLFALLWCYSFFSPPEQCHQNWPASHRGWGQTLFLNQWLLGFYPDALCTQSPYRPWLAAVGLPHHCCPWTWTLFSLSPGSSAAELALPVHRACGSSPVHWHPTLTSDLSHFHGPASQSWAYAQPWLPSWDSVLTLACRMASHLASRPAPWPWTCWWVLACPCPALLPGWGGGTDLGCQALKGPGARAPGPSGSSGTDRAELQEEQCGLCPQPRHQSSICNAWHRQDSVSTRTIMSPSHHTNVRERVPFTRGLRLCDQEREQDRLSCPWRSTSSPRQLCLAVHLL